MRYALLGLLILLIMGKKARILARQLMRNDAAGLGHFGARRGSRTHQGLDLLAVEGEPIYSPVTGRYVRSGRPYANDNRYRLIVLHGDGREWKLMYVEPLPTMVPGKLVRAGELVGMAQNIAAKYGGSMKNHVHVETRQIVGGDLIDPATLLHLV